MVVKVGEYTGPQAERIVENEPLRLLVTTETSFRTNIVCLRDLSPLFEESTDTIDLRNRYQCDGNRSNSGKADQEAVSIADDLSEPTRN